MNGADVHEVGPCRKPTAGNWNLPLSVNYPLPSSWLFRSRRLKAMLLPETYPELFIAISRFSNHRVARHRAKGGSHSQSSAVVSRSRGHTAATCKHSATHLQHDLRYRS